MGARIVLTHEDCVEFTKVIFFPRRLVQIEPVFRPFSGERTGRVKTVSGQPITGEIVFYPRSERHRRRRRVDRHGVFHLDGLHDRRLPVAIRYGSFGSHRTHIDAESDDSPVVTLDADEVLTVDVVDRDGSPIPNAVVYYRRANGANGRDSWRKVPREACRGASDLLIADLPADGNVEIVGWTGRRLPRHRYGRAIVDMAEVNGSRRASLILGKAQSLGVRIVDASGEPLTYAVSTTRPLLGYTNLSDAEDLTAFVGRPCAAATLAFGLQHTFLYQEETKGEFVLTIYEGMNEDLYILSKEGGARLESAQFHDLRDGMTIRVDTRMFLTGQLIPAESNDFFTRRLAVTLESGKTVETTCDRYGDYCIWIGSDRPAKVDVVQSRRAIHSWSPQVGVIERVQLPALIDGRD